MVHSINHPFPNKSNHCVPSRDSNPQRKMLPAGVSSASSSATAAAPSTSSAAAPAAAPAAAAAGPGKSDKSPTAAPAVNNRRTRHDSQGEPEVARSPISFPTRI